MRTMLSYFCVDPINGEFDFIAVVERVFKEWSSCQSQSHSRMSASNIIYSMNSGKRVVPAISPPARIGRSDFASSENWAQQFRL